MSGKDPNNRYDLSIIIPTFKEEENVVPMVRAIDRICKDSGIDCEIIVVDDSSPDRTAELVRDLQSKMPNLSLIVRTQNPGLSPSIYDGIRHARAPIVQCIDCDFSHPPEKIPDFYYYLHELDYDMVLGSRYVEGGRVQNWSIHRELLSHGAALLGRILIPSVRDSGSGFFAINTRILENVRLTPRGFRMGFEILGKSRWERVMEIPITFKDREHGASKLRWRIIIQYLIQWFSILRYNLVEKDCHSIRRSWVLFLQGQ